MYAVVVICDVLCSAVQWGAVFCFHHRGSPVTAQKLLYQRGSEFLSLWPRGLNRAKSGSYSSLSPFDKDVQSTEDHRLTNSKPIIRMISALSFTHHHVYICMMHLVSLRYSVFWYYSMCCLYYWVYSICPDYTQRLINNSKCTEWLF